MLDVLLIGAFAFLSIRGWYRGFVREAMDLVGLLAGTVLAFRLGPAVGTVIESMAGTSADASRLVGGMIVFFAVGIGAAFATRAIEGKARMPGLNLVNRAGGAGLAMSWGVFLATIVLTLGVVLPMPPAVTDTLEGSAVAGTLTDPGGAPQRLFNALAGDRIVEALMNLQDVVGERRVVLEGADSLDLPAASPGELQPGPGDAAAVFDLLNRARVDAGLDPLAWSAALAEVGEAHAAEMYLDGYFSHVSPSTGTVGDRLHAAGITFLVAGENLALAATAEEVHDGLMASPGHRANIESPDYNRVGIGVIRGPLGLMTVQVFTG
ncbi:MAG: CvpA family protein [Actinobacteria bacterium]|nr:CvpA family protein [Actinomycetota bacterium]